MPSCSSIPSTSSPITFDVQSWMNSSCFQCESNGCPATYDSKCVFYTGPNLSCSGITTGDNLESALQKIDEQICSAIGDYSNYQFHCLTDWFGQAITQESQFVSAITEYVCEITENFNTFTESTFTAYQADVSQRFTDVVTPSLTCSSAGVTALDDLQTILEKYCSKFVDIDDALSLSGVDWDQCLTVVSSPTTIADAFSLVVDQICQVEALTGAALPTFNNTGTCLASPGTADSLVSTIGKITTRLCQSPTYDGDNITWGCIEEPADNTSIEDGIQNIITGLNSSLQALPTFDGSDFIVTATDPMDPCAGVTVALATPLNQDRFFALNGGDSSPSTWQSKVVAGANLTFDYASSPGQVILNASSATLDYKVKASSGDTTPDFLDQKIVGSSDSGISISPTYNSINEQLDLTLSVNTSSLLDLLLDELVVGSDLYAKFCEKVALCPCNCGTTDCTYYSITGDSFTPSVSVTWVDCSTGATQNISLATGSTIEVCARSGSVFTIAPGNTAFIILSSLGSCAGGTTSTSTSTTTSS